jgi:putative peptide zinc metalloprotease protein
MAGIHDGKQWVETNLKCAEYSEVWKGKQMVERWGEDKVSAESVESVSLWERLGERVEEEPGEAALNLWEILGAKVDFAKYRPKRICNFELTEGQTAQGQVYYMLKNPDAGTYLQLGEQELFLWNMMDGEHSVRDMSIAFLLKYGALPIELIINMLATLQSKSFLEKKPVNLYQKATQTLAKRAMQSKSPLYLIALKIVGFILKVFFWMLGGNIVTLRNIDQSVGILHRRGGRLLFHRIIQYAYILLVILGVAAVLIGPPSLQGGAATETSTIILIYLGLIVTVLVHEGAHALTCKHYGREVKEGGLSFYLGTLAAFVDTTDMWMEPHRKHRMAVSWAGPFSNLILGAICSLGILMAPWPRVDIVLTSLATVNFLLFFMNLNPLLEWDGYYMLMDYLEIPCLRKRSLDFVRNHLWGKLKARESFNREEKIFTVFGILAGLWTAIVIVMFVVFLPQRIMGWVRSIAGWVSKFL